MRKSALQAPALVLAALVVPPAVAAVLSAWRDTVSPTNAALVLVLVVVAVAAGGSRVAGVLAALSSAAWLDFFLIRPYLTFTIAEQDGVETAVLLCLVGLGVTEIVLWGRRQQSRASQREGYLDGMVHASAMAADATQAPRVVLDFIGRQITEILRVDRAAYADGPPGTHPRIARDGSVVRDGNAIDVERFGLPTNDVIELPVGRDGAVVGRFVLTAATRVARPGLEQRMVAVTLADQAGAALGGRGTVPARLDP